VSSSQRDVRVDRRFNRPPLLTCPKGCVNAAIRVMSRVRHALYLRCERCRHLWGVPKPGLKPLAD
jgi:hypothetical protein